MSRQTISFRGSPGGVVIDETTQTWAVYSGARQTIEASETSRGFTPVTRKESVARKNTSRVLRRLKGFLIEHIDRECKVAFIDDGKTIIYFLPANRLEQAGITHKNQPFEMDEFERKNEDGSFSTGYTFRPLASSSDAFTEPLTLDDERKTKLNQIFQKLGKTKA